MIARWNAKDATAFSEALAEDATFTDVIGQTARGRGAIATQHEFPFTRNMRLAVLTADSVDVRPLGEDAAVSDPEVDHGQQTFARRKPGATSKRHDADRGADGERRAEDR